MSCIVQNGPTRFVPVLMESALGSTDRSQIRDLERTIYGL